MTIFKSSNMTAVIKSGSSDIGDLGAKFYTKDINTTSFNIRVMKDDKFFNFNEEQYKPYINLFMGDGSIFLDEELEILEAENGLIAYNLKDKVKHAGWLKAKLILKKDSESIHVTDFRMEIIDSGLDKAVAKEIDVDILMKTFEDFAQRFPEKIRGKAFTYDDFTEEQLALLKGDKGDKGERGQDGKSAYEVAVANGFKGSEAEWITSLKNEFIVGEPVKSKEELPSEAKKNEVRLVQDENKQYVFDGTKWIEFGAANLDGLTPIKDEVNNVQHAVNQLFTRPLYIETLTSFGKYGTGVPTGVSNYAGGNYVLTVDGQEGDNYFTVKSGNIADAGQTTKWAAVLQYADLTFDGYQVTGTDGVDRVYVYPNVKKSVTGAKLGNLHDMAQGQHYTELGYKAFGQHIFNNAGYYAQRNQYIAKFSSADTSGAWQKIGDVTGITYNWGLSPVDANSKLLIGESDINLVFTTDNVGEGLEWTVPINKKAAYFDGSFGIQNGGAYKVEVIADGNVLKSITIDKNVEHVVCDVSYSLSAKVRATALTDTSTTVRIGNCTWFELDKVPSNIFNTVNKKAVYLGDSWGTYHNAANPKEIERLWQQVNPNATVINRSQGGMTTKYARVWFDEYVLKEKPDILILEYFTNDINTIVNNKLGLDFNAPDGKSYRTTVTEQEYLENIRYMVNKCIQNNIQPVVILPSIVEGQTQTQNHAKYNTILGAGGSAVPKNLSLNEVSTENTKSNTIFTDKVETLTEFDKALEVITSYAGLTVKPRVMMYDGSVFRILNNDGSIIAQFNADPLKPHQMPALELTGIYAEQGLHLPNTQIVDNAEVLKFKARAGKTIKKIILGEGVKDEIELPAPLKICVVDTLPVADQFSRFREIVLRGKSGVADKRYICIKNERDTYEWKEL